VEAGVVVDEEEEVANVPFPTEQNTDVQPAVYHQQSREEAGWGGLPGPHRQLEMERILRGDCKRVSSGWASDLGKECTRGEGECDLSD